MFLLVRTIALRVLMLFSRFYAAAPASPYEAILFGYIKALLAQLLFREVPRGVV